MHNPDQNFLTEYNDRMIAEIIDPPFNNHLNDKIYFI